MNSQIGESESLFGMRGNEGLTSLSDFTHIKIRIVRMLPINKTEVRPA